MATRVLIVDDNAQDRVLAIRALMAEFPDLVVTEVRNQAELDPALARLDYDVVVTDYQLRWTDGLKVLAAIQAANPAMPVVMFTNTGSEEVAASGLRMGLADYIIKGPTHFGRLAHGVRTALMNADIKRREQEIVVREREALRLAEQSNRMKDEFLATVSHELRNPLNAIRGWVKVLQTPHEPATAQRAVSSLDRNTETLARLIEDLVDESAIASGKLRLRLRPVDFQSILNAVIESLRPAIHAKRLTLSVTEGSTLALVAADSDRLQQMIWNLLVNAVKFTPPDGSITLDLRQSGPNVEFTVKDTGEGIRADYLPFIFERFSQQDSGTTRAHGGLGLGLSIVRDLAELHGGTVSALSAGEGCGATFTLSLPQSTLHEVPQPATGNEPQLANVRVLVVDDDVDARDIMKQLLSDAGASVSTAGSAAEALLNIRRCTPDVLVCDIGMPKVDGYALIRRIREDDNPAIAQLPAVAVTAFANHRDREQSLGGGFQFHLSKPISPGDLGRVVGLLAARER